MLNPSWLRLYYHEINERVERRDGSFQALQYIYINTNNILPTQYFDLLPKQEPPIVTSREGLKSASATLPL